MGIESGERVGRWNPRARLVSCSLLPSQAGRWTPTHKELETSDSQQGRISSAATHIPSKQRSYLFCQQMAFKKELERTASSADSPTIQHDHGVPRPSWQRRAGQG